MQQELKALPVTAAILKSLIGGQPTYRAMVYLKPNDMPADCNGAVADGLGAGGAAPSETRAKQSASAKIFDSRGFARHSLFPSKRQRTAVATTDFLRGFEASCEDSVFGGQRPPRLLAKQKRIVGKVDALMAWVDTFEQQLDDSRTAAEVTAA
jgi:hypothetical protein